MHDRGSRERRETALPRSCRCLVVGATASLLSVAAQAQAHAQAVVSPPAAAPEGDATIADAPAEPSAAASKPAAEGSDTTTELAEQEAGDGDPTESTEQEAGDGDPTESAEQEAGDGEAQPPVDETIEAPRPPRIDGPYLGLTMFGGLGLLRVNNIEVSGPATSFGGTLTVGQMVFPWLGLGLHGGGGGGVRSESGARQRYGQGHIGMQFKFVPLPQRLPLSFMASLGFGGGALRQAGVESRTGYGGAQFGASARYEWFPGASRYRPNRGGGFGLGPEIGWIGFTPAAKGRPMSNVLYVALSATFYFGD